MRMRAAVAFLMLALVVGAPPVLALAQGEHQAHGASAVVGQIDLLGFVVLGLLGSVAHCVGMCSPFVLVVSRRYGPPHGRHSAAAAQLWYTAGRILTYSALGAVAGALGGVVAVAGAWFGIQRLAATVAGALLIAWGLSSLSDIVPRVQGCGGWFSRVTGTLKGRLPGHPLAIGLFLGLLPCGLLYSAVIAAVGRGGPVEGAMALAAFGIGTAPALIGVSAADVLLARHRVSINRLSHLFVLVMGVWFLWRGLAA